jgi:site-specific recombinase XerD
MNIHVLLEEFCHHSIHFRGYTEATISRYKQTVKALMKHAETESIDNITEQMIYTFFMNGRTSKNWKTATFITYQKSLLVFFRWCVKKGVLERNYIEDVDVPRLEKRIPPKLNKEQALRILEVAYNYPYPYHFLRYRNQAIFATFLHAGLRKGELLKLRLDDVDIQGLTIFIRQAKGHKDRIIPMSYSLAHILTEYLKERKRLNKTCPEFFTSLNRNNGLSDTGIKRLTNLIRETTGIHFTIHKLRHTFATLMLEGGCDIFSLSKMMGHSSIKTTTIYLTASAEHLRGQMYKHPLNSI